MVLGIVIKFVEWRWLWDLICTQWMHYWTSRTNFWIKAVWHIFLPSQSTLVFWQLGWQVIVLCDTSILNINLAQAFVIGRMHVFLGNWDGGLLRPHNKEFWSLSILIVVGFSGCKVSGVSCSEWSCRIQLQIGLWGSCRLSCKEVGPCFWSCDGWLGRWSIVAI